MSEIKLSYAEAIAEVEAIVRTMQDQWSDVDKLGAMVARATELIAYCTEKLRHAQAEVEKAAKLN